MAAEQRAGRTCQNGCGRSLEHLRLDAKWCSTCKTALERHRKHEARRNRAKEAGRWPSRRKSGEKDKATPHPRCNVVMSRRADEKPRAQAPCKVCCGMPWARVTDRYTEGRFDEEPVSVDGVRCRGCGELYAPEPAPERESSLRSSAGTTVRAAPLYASDVWKGEKQGWQKGNK